MPIRLWFQRGTQQLIMIYNADTFVVSAWDQSDKFMKIYVTLDGVQNISAENITVECKDRYLMSLNAQLLYGCNKDCCFVD